MNPYIKLARVHQWVKNLFVFLPVFFAFRLFEVNLLLCCLLAFIGMSCVASSIYILNDYVDREQDRLHPEKKNRPLASGVISPQSGFVFMAFLLLIGFGIYVFVLKSLPASLLLLGYFVMNIFYSFKLKNIAIVDITTISVGFLLRLFIGGVVTGIVLSKWIIIMTFLLAMLLALGKRRDDVLHKLKSGDSMRKSIDGYSLNFIDSSIVIMCAVIIMAYIMYAISPEVEALHGDMLYLSSIFVVLGILRYLQIGFIEEASGSPTQILLKDRFIQITMLLWVLTFFALMYFNKSDAI